MTHDDLEALFARVRSWPTDLQMEVADFLRSFEQDQGEATYHLSPEELAAVDEGLAAAERGAFASDEDVARLFRLKR